MKTLLGCIKTAALEKGVDMWKMMEKFTADEFDVILRASELLHTDSKSQIFIDGDFNGGYESRVRKSKGRLRFKPKESK